jgi:23S rRNA (guanosine2251-2'-O)-methyltransferase
VVEVLRARVPANVLYVAQRVESDDRIREAIKMAANRGIPLLEVSRDKLDRLTEGAVHQGLALQLPPYEYAHPDDLVHRAQDAAEIPLIIALDSVTDPRNLGAIARSATAFGAHGILVPSRRSAGVTAGAWKTSAGALAHLPVARAANLTSTLREYREQGLFVVGLDGEGPMDIGDVQLATEPLVVVVGSEGKGLSRLVRESCDVVARIPMSAAAESLNAGVAAGIALYEIARLRRG